MPENAELQLHLVAECPAGRLGGLDDAAWSKAPADLISDPAHAANSASYFSEHAHNCPRQATRLPFAQAGGTPRCTSAVRAEPRSCGIFGGTSERTMAGDDGKVALITGATGRFLFRSLSNPKLSAFEALARIASQCPMHFTLENCIEGYTKVLCAQAFRAGRWWRCWTVRRRCLLTISHSLCLSERYYHK